jgi:hypothetical protein
VLRGTGASVGTCASSRRSHHHNRGGSSLISLIEYDRFLLACCVQTARESALRAECGALSVRARDLEAALRIAQLEAQRAERMQAEEQAQLYRTMENRRVAAAHLEGLEAQAAAAAASLAQGQAAHAAATRVLEDLRMRMDRAKAQRSQLEVELHAAAFKQHQQQSTAAPAAAAGAKQGVHLPARPARTPASAEARRVSHPPLPTLAPTAVFEEYPMFDDDDGDSDLLVSAPPPVTPQPPRKPLPAPHAMQTAAHPSRGQAPGQQRAPPGGSTGKTGLAPSAAPHPGQGPQPQRPAPHPTKPQAPASSGGMRVATAAPPVPGLATQAAGAGVYSYSDYDLDIDLTEVGW